MKSLELAYARLGQVRSGRVTACYRIVRAEPTEGYFRERFDFYQAVLKAMKPHAGWINLQFKTTQKQKLLVGDQAVAEIGNVDVRGWAFDAKRFDFRWQDNTPTGYYNMQPWTWVLSLEADYPEYTHAFVTQGKAIVHAGNNDTIDFYGFALPSGPRRFFPSV